MSDEPAIADGHQSRMETQAAYDCLVAIVQRCRLCPTMEGRRRVLGNLNGDAASAQVAFIAEAPGRLGAERTGTPLLSDQTGRNFNRFLACTGWTRNDTFITNSVLCNPQDNRGLNRPPSRQESANCLAHLIAQLDLLHAHVVVTLGAKALAALEQITPHGLTLRTAVGEGVRWRGRWLVPLYHPGPQALLHRPQAIQENDYRALWRFYEHARTSAASKGIE